MTKYKQATTAVRSGLNYDEQYGCIVPPITLSSTYNFIDFNKPRIYDYSRRRNPTRDIVQSLLAKLEGGIGAIITNSGMSAIYLLCTTFLTHNDLIVAPYDCYGGSYRLLNQLSKRGIYKVKFINQSNHQEIIDVMIEQPKLILIETPSNPLLRVVDISTICDIAHQTNTLCVVDNTFMTPILQQPIKFGADLVLHSCTKYLNGHSDIIAGAIIAKKNDVLNELAIWGNNTGVTSSAFDSYLLLRGMRTLTSRIYQHQNNAKSIVEYLQQKSQVKKLYYPGLSSNVGYSIACKQQNGFGAIVSFELDGNIKTLRKFLTSLKIFTLAESLGGVESLIAHSATMTHAGMNEEERAKAGISDMLLRISIGIEDVQDLIADLEQAFQLL